jgi:L-lactate dehydrogenase
MPISDVLANKAIAEDPFRKSVEDDVRFANITIIEGIGASQYGIGMVAGRIAEVILRDERAVIPVGSTNNRYGTTLSLPSVVGGKGVEHIMWPSMSPTELSGLERCADRLRSITAQYLA